MLAEKLADIELLFTIRSEGEGGERLWFVAPEINDINFVKNIKLNEVFYAFYKDNEIFIIKYKVY